MPVPANARTAEMVIDGPTLTHVLGTPAEETLAELGAQCGAVVICRASPSQKAAIVRLMTQYELKVAEKGSKGLLRWIRRQARRQVWSPPAKLTSEFCAAHDSTCCSKDFPISSHIFAISLETN